MGKGDKKTKKGKLAKSSFGNSRPQRIGNGTSLPKPKKGDGLTELPGNPLKKEKK